MSAGECAVIVRKTLADHDCDGRLRGQPVERREAPLRRRLAEDFLFAEISRAAAFDSVRQRDMADGHLTNAADGEAEFGRGRINWHGEFTFAL